MAGRRRARTPPRRLPRRRRCEVRIEPGGAFGLGDHPTTLLSLRALVRLVDGDEPTEDVLDVGCGTGVLAVTAALLLDRPVRAVDVASAAVEASIDNARRNDVDELVHVDATHLADIEGDYDLVLANILAPTLVALAADLRRVTRPAGRLVRERSPRRRTRSRARGACSDAGRANRLARRLGVHRAAPSVTNSRHLGARGVSG